MERRDFLVNRWFLVVETSNGNITRRLPYSPKDEGLLLSLKERNEKGEIKLRCGCSKDIELKISNAKSPYLYNATRQFKHSLDCCRHHEFVGLSPYEKAWSYDEEKGIHIVRIESLLLPQSTEIKKTANITTSNPIYHEGRGTKKNVSTILGLARRINMMAWESMVLGHKQKIPDTKYELAKQVYGVASHIRLSNKRTTLNEMFYKRINIRSVKVNKDIYFVYMYVDDLEEGSLYDGTKKDILLCEDAFGNTNRFYVDKEEFEQKKKNEPHSSKFVVAGFAYKEDKYHRYMTLNNYCLMPVSESGLFCESSHEKNIYDFLCNNKIRFYKPYLPIEEYGNYIPDGLILNEKNKDIIFEVFGMIGMPSYDEKKDEKIALSKTEAFKRKYDFKSWEPK